MLFQLLLFHVMLCYSSCCCMSCCYDVIPGGIDAVMLCLCNIDVMLFQVVLLFHVILGGAPPGGWKPTLHSSANADIEARKRKFQNLATQAIDRCEMLKRKAAQIDNIPGPPTDDPEEGEGKEL